jgi:heat shock protein HslJ
MQREQHFLALLRQVEGILVENGKLTLLAKDGSHLTTLIRRGAQ